MCTYSHYVCVCVVLSQIRKQHKVDSFFSKAAKSDTQTNVS